MMTPDDKLRRLIDEAARLQQELGLTGIAIVATDFQPNGCTGDYDTVAGNRHAALGAAANWLEGCRAYDAAYKAEAGRYDAVVHRQRKQVNDAPDN